MIAPSGTTPLTHAVIGAGPTGLAAARNLDRHGLAWTGYELAPGVGGLWDIENPRTTIYESAHLISSRTTTEFAEFPMDDGCRLPQPPRAHALLPRLRRPLRPAPSGSGSTRGDRARPADGERLAACEHRPGRRRSSTATRQRHPRQRHPRRADGARAPRARFAGELLHTSAYKRAAVFAGKRVLIIGAGNSGCDIAVDAVHYAASVDMSVRRGYYFVPRYLFGRPSDTLNQGRPLPARIKQFDRQAACCRLFTGDPVRFGFPKPDYKIYESHPIVNTLVLNHLGQGDLRVRARHRPASTAHGVHLRRRPRATYDLVLLATGYHLHYPFVDRDASNWEGARAGRSSSTSSRRRSTASSCSA